ncbi:MAG TPA: uracil-DNA glycosylase [Chloroflexota bacterium]|nr:uracil-DNA glycosylase [Chloroflexota bacterium]
MLSRDAELRELRQAAEQQGIEVFGEGNLSAPLMLVGEAPGQVEVERGRPFQGPAGRVLDELLDRLAIPRSELYITNVVKIRPYVENGRNRVNRPPRAGEVHAFSWILDREIAIVRPRVIVCLGAVAANALIHPKFALKQDRGRWFEGPEGARILATYHPSYLLRLRGPDYEVARDATAADLAKAWAAAQEPRRATAW